MKSACSFKYDFVLLIPCYNNLPGLVSSLQSVHYASNKFFVLMVDDGSSDPVTVDVLATFLTPGFPLHVLRLPFNQGITVALNAGLQHINSSLDTQYIARLDCGDICAENRFIKQVQFLNCHADIDIAGSWCFFKNFTTGTQYLYKTPTEHAKLYRGMAFRNMFIHPTVMWRTAVMQQTGLYPHAFLHAEDYGLFYTILQQGRGGVIPEPLVTCEMNPDGISLSYRKKQLKSRMKVIRHFCHNRLLKLLGVVKLQLMLGIPYPLILSTKRILYGKQ
jgi:glycosyltransferase involved in cell wall biosynthesis